MTPAGSLLAGTLVALVVALLLPTSARLPRGVGAGPGDGVALRRGRFGVVLSGIVVAGAVVLLDGVRLALALVVLGGATGALHLRRRERRRRSAARTRAAVVEVGEALVGELRAGHDVVTALARAATPWEPFRAVARAAALGADVPAALRRLAREPGAEGLRDLATAWQVAGRTGGGLADVLTQVVVGGRGVHEDLRTVGTELASARATARLMVLLPVVTLGLAAGAGGAPWRLLVSEPFGVACLAGGTGLTLAGLLWIDRIADGAVAR